MTTILESLPRIEIVEPTTGMPASVIPFTPGGEGGGIFYNGYVHPEWFSEVFTSIANEELPASKEIYEKFKSIDMFWKINVIQWRKAGVFDVEGIEQDQLIEEEEEFMTELFPPPPPEAPAEEEEEPTEEGPTEGEETPSEDPEQDEEAPAEDPAEQTEEEEKQEEV